MRAVNFASNRRRRPQPIVWNNFQGVNEVDDNVNLPDQQVPYAQNVDFGRIVGSAAKRYGMESIISDIRDLNEPHYTGGLTATLSPASAVGQTWSTGVGVTNLSRLMLRQTVLNISPEGVTVSVYADATKAVLIGSTANLSIYVASNFWEVIFNPSLTLIASTSYYLEITSATETYILNTSSSSSHAGQLYINGVADATRDLYQITYMDLGAGGCKGQHTFQSTAGDIPLIAVGTDVYKLSGASTSRTTDTEAEFNAGTKTDVVVLGDAPAAPATAITLGSSGGTGLTGDYYGKVSFVDVTGAESPLSAASNKYTASNTHLYWYNIPIGPAGTTQRKLYRTKAGGKTYYLDKIIDNNTDTGSGDALTDFYLTVEWEAKRVILGAGTTKGAAVITQTSTSNLLSIGTSVGQTITIPTGIKKIYSIAPYIIELGAGESVMLTLYSGVDKATTIGSASLTGAIADGYMEFVLNTVVTPGAIYYYEIVGGPASSVKCYLNNPSVYSGGQMYISGSAQTEDMAFYVYGCKYVLTGAYESELIDLTTAPTVSALTFTETLNGQTVAWFSRCSSDNSVWGDWQAVISSGDGIPLGRYVQIKYVMGSVDGTLTPSIKDYTLTYSVGYGTATSIKSGLSGGSVHFVDWDDRVWFCDGGKPQVWDGTEERDVGNMPATAPTIAVSGSGSFTGVYMAKVTYIKDGFEGNTCALYGTVTAASNGQIDWSAIPTKEGYKRILYRTKANSDAYYYVTTISDDTTTTYADTVADASLGGTLYPAFDGDNNAPPNSTIIHVHKNYMFYVEAAMPNRVYVSKVNLPDHIPSADYFQFPGAVLGIKTHGDYLVVSGKNFLEYTAGSIFDADPSVGDWDFKTIDRIGCIAHEAMVEAYDASANQMLIMPTEQGLKYLSPNLLGSNLQSTPLSRNVQHYFDEAINRETMSAIFHKQAYYIAFNWADPVATPGTTNNVVFKLDLRNREWSGPWFINVSGFFIIGSSLYMASSTTGRVYKHSGTSDDGVAIDMIIDSSYKGSWEKRNFAKLIAMVKRGSVTTGTTILTRVDNLERTIALGSCAGWAGSGGSARDVQDEVTSPQKAISGGRGFNMGWRFEDDSVNDVVLYGITVLAELPT